MNFLQIIGIVSISITVIVLVHKLYRLIFGYSESSCPNDHDEGARHGGGGICSKCGGEW